MSISIMPPCQAACPIHTDVRGYVSAIARGDVETAIKIIRQVNPFPAVCGRICTRVCETACRRGQVDEPIAIGALKRFASDQTKGLKFSKPPGPYYNERIAIIGSGPAGLTAAHDLALLGYKVTVFEAQKELGGMLISGIPEYRLPKSIVKDDIDFILSMGVDAKTGMALGKDFSIDDLLKEYQAVFLALGSERSLYPKCKGIELPGIITAVEFLKNVSRGERPYLGENIVIIGGGHTAIDAARTCIRLGAKNVSIVYRRTLKEMPAGREEVEEAEAEGVKFYFLAAPIEFLGTGKVEAVRCVKMQLDKKSGSKRGALIRVEDSEFDIKADAVILAIGYEPKVDTLKDIELILGKGGTIVVKDESGTTNIKGVFAGGDVVSGPMTVVQAIASGKRGADAIHRYLRKLPPKEIEEPTIIRPLDEKIVDLIVKTLRQKMPSLPVQERIKTFDEVNIGFTWEQALTEAQRCLNCGAGAVISDECVACFNCVLVCPYGVPVAGEEKAKIDISQCQACGICASECPASAIDVKIETKAKSREKLEEALKIAKKESPENFVIEFHCEFQESKAASDEKAGIYKIGKPCMAWVDVAQLLRPFESGANAVHINKCEYHECRFKGCEEWILKHVEGAKRILEEIGLDSEKLKVVYGNKNKK